MEFLRKVGAYLTLKRSPKGTTSFNLRAMHTINKISIFMFLAALVILFYKFVLRG